MQWVRRRASLVWVGAASRGSDVGGLRVGEEAAERLPLGAAMLIGVLAG